MGSDPTNDRQLTVRNVSRRQWLGMLAATGATSVAGCGGGGDETTAPGDGDGDGDGDGGADTTEEPDGTVGDVGDTSTPTEPENFFEDRQFQLAFTSYPPTDMQFNPTAPQQNQNFGGTNFRTWAYGQIATNNLVTGALWLLLADDLTWNLDADTPNVEVSIQENWTWWPSGNGLTVEDWADQIRMGKYGVAQMDDLTSTVASLELVDDYTIRFNLKTADINRRIWTGNLATYLMTEHSRYEGYVQDLAEADGLNSIEEIDETYGEEISNEEAVTEVRQSIQNEPIDEPYGHMPMELAERNEQEFIFELDEDHAAADAFNFGGVYMEYTGAEASTQAFLNEQLDVNRNLPSQYVGENTPDFATEISYPSGVGPWLLFNMGREPGNSVHFRRAVMHLVNREDLASALGFRWDPIGIPCGMDAGQPEQWLPNTDAFNPYERDTERAAEELRAGGWERNNDDEWVDGDGEPLAPVVKTNGSNTQWTTTAQFTSTRLEEFGASPEFLTEEGSTFLGQTLPGRDYDIGVRFAGGWSTYPYNAFNGDMASSRAADEYAMPDSVEVPPIGEFDADPSEEIVVQDLLDEAAATPDEDRITEIFEQLAWVWNWYMPVGPMTSQLGVQYFNTDRWDIPEDAADIPGGNPQLGDMGIEGLLRAIE